MVAEEIGHDRIVLLLGPVRRSKVALRRWRSFYDEAAQFPVFTESARAVGPASAQVAVHLGGGRWRGWGSAARTDASYVVSTLRAMEAAVTHWVGAPSGPALCETASPLRAWATDWLAHLIASGGAHGPGSRRTIKITDSTFSYLFSDDEIGDHFAGRPGSESSRRGSPTRAGGSADRPCGLRRSRTPMDARGSGSCWCSPTGRGRSGARSPRGRWSASTRARLAACLVVTTDEEIDGFQIIRAIVCSEVTVSRIAAGDSPRRVRRGPRRRAAYQSTTPKTLSPFQFDQLAMIRV